MNETRRRQTFIYTYYAFVFLIIYIGTFTNGFDWCALDSGYTTINDGNNYPQVVYISATADGSIWIRFGGETNSQNWAYIDETKIRLQATLLTKTDLAILNSLNFSEACALTDIDLTLEEHGSWHPSFVNVFDVTDRVTRTMSFKMNRECQTMTAISLSPAKQRIECNGGDRSLCGFRNLPPLNHQSKPLFLTHVTADPSGADHWSCWPESGSSSYEFRGSYYFAYIKMAQCAPPTESRVFGHEAKLRPQKDVDEENTVIIGDPTEGALSDGTITHWQLYVSWLSTDYDIYLQIWRPSSLVTSSNNFTLVQQTHYRPSELRFQEVTLPSNGGLDVKAGDVIGLYFPNHNPTCFTIVPCASTAQHYRYYRPPLREPLALGNSYSFTTAAAGEYACRQYSVRGVLGKKLDAKVIESWRCPEDHSRRVPDTDGHQLTLSDSSQPTYQKPAPATKRNSSIVPADAVIPIQLLIILIGCLMLVTVIICCVLYYRVKSK